MYWPCLLEANGARHRTYVALLFGPSIQQVQEDRNDQRRIHASLLGIYVDYCDGALASRALSPSGGELIDPAEAVATMFIAVTWAAEQGQRS